MSTAAPSGLGHGPPDSLGMWSALRGAASQLSCELPPELSIAPPRLCAVVGMGGSGIAGDLAQAAATLWGRSPVVVVKDERLPRFVDEGALVVAVSFSGNTRETLAAFSEALRRRATVVGVSRGGRLEEACRKAGVPHIGIGQAGPQPRAGLYRMAALVLSLLEQAGVLEGVSEMLGASRAWLSGELESLVDQGAALAASVTDRIVLSYGSVPFAALAAVRLKNQLNENAKAPAFFSAYPELCHNELAGWGQLGDLTRQLFFLVEFRSGWDSPDQQVRSAFLREALGEVLAGQACLECRAPNPLAEFFGLSVMADALSLEVARRLEIDPGPVPVLEELKARLEKAGASSGPPPF